eukprot:TRINITY_DN11263_c0_g1_i1.p1 TRINITY_DN11263_c0_g1~~TRINITY_DN11263_c0_g1_i1.p1  ORF type:complete len:788 (-),score=70.66 TRINITY_DN11263_c0_g1_i1:14-2377(-)
MHHLSIIVMRVSALALAPLAHVHAGSDLRGLDLQSHWQQWLDDGVLDAGYLDWLNCKGTMWHDFRLLFVAHMESGGWNFANEADWVGRPEHWKLIKTAEELLDIWRRQDLIAVPGENLTVAEAMGTYTRTPSKTPLGIVDKSVIATLLVSHLQRIAKPNDWRIQYEGGDSGSICLHGLVAAIAVFARALTVIGLEVPLAEGSDDGFILWRLEATHILTAIMFREGALALDLTASPGWPGVHAGLVESLLVESQPGIRRRRDPSSDANQAWATAGSPSRLVEPRPTRMPRIERYHRGTDPMGVTHWGARATEWLAAHSEMIFERTMNGKLPDWNRIGPAWFKGPSPREQRKMLSPGRVRLLALVAQHGALDIEIPELLAELFPSFLDVQYMLYGEKVIDICKGTEASVMTKLCPLASERLDTWTDPDGKSAASHVVHGEASDRPLAAKWLPDPHDPRLFFPDAGGGPPGAAPEMITVCGWIDAIWARGRFPNTPLVLFFGPPVLLHVGLDIKEGRQDVAINYWNDVSRLFQCAAEGLCLVAAESLFRSEQLYFQTGVEVPFLRPMSVWVNASFSPLMNDRGGGSILVHMRGRLRYETHFAGMLQNFAGPAFRHELVTQTKPLPFKNIATFYAVVILPWSPELCMLRHLFKMRMPLFVPGRRLLRNMVHLSNQRLMPHPYNLPAPFSNRTAMERQHPLDPFVDTARWPADIFGVESRIYWAEYSEYLLLPVLQQFNSAADLVTKLQTFHGHRISQRIGMAHAQDMDEMRSFWVPTLKQLLQESGKKTIV